MRIDDFALLVLRRWWWVLLLSTLLAGAAAYLVGAQTPVVYEASTRLLVGPFHANSDTQRAAGQLTQTYAELIRSQRVVQATVDELSLGISSRELSDSVQARGNTVTRVLTVSLVGSDSERAVAVVNALARNLISFSAMHPALPEGQIAVIDPAQASNTPVSPRPLFFGAIGAIAGSLAALVLAASMEYLDNGVRTTRRLAALTRLPVLASLRPRPRWFGLRATDGLVDPGSPEGFAMDLLSAKIEFSRQLESRARSVVLLPVDPRGGSAWVGVNLVGSLGLRGRSVALLDVDPSAEASRLLTRNARLLSDRHRVSPIMQVVRRPPDELGHISGGRATEILESLLLVNGVIVVQAPSAQIEPNALVWASAGDAVVLVVRDSDPAPAVAELASALRLMAAPVIGSIFVHGHRARLPTKIPLPEADHPGRDGVHA